jgi:hypothetical protein
MRTFLQYVSALLGAIGTVAIVAAVLSSAPGAFADQPLTALDCACPNGGDGDCYSDDGGTCSDDSCGCCACELPIVCEWDFFC